MEKEKRSRHLRGNVLPQRVQDSRVRSLVGGLVGDRVHAECFKDLLVVALAGGDDNGSKVREAHAGHHDVAAGARLKADGDALGVGKGQAPFAQGLGVATSLVVRVGGEDAQKDVRALSGKVALAALAHGVAEGVELYVLGIRAPVILARGCICGRIWAGQ